jgi:hypothetical protein
MDVPAHQSTPKGASRGRASTRILWSPRRRRPTGEPPPLPYHLQTSGVGWLVAVEVTVADDTVVSWLSRLHAPGLIGVSRALAAISS